MHAIENAKIIRNYFRESSKKSIEMIKFTEIIFFHQRSYNLQIKLNIINSKGDKNVKNVQHYGKKHQNTKTSKNTPATKIKRMNIWNSVHMKKMNNMKSQN